MDIKELSHRLVEYRICYATERDFQDGVEAALSLLATNYQLTFEREYRLSAADRPDFFLPAEGIVIECKIKGSTSEVIRQLHRYAEHEAVTGIILATSRTTHQVPLVLNGKPIYVACFRSL